MRSRIAAAGFCMQLALGAVYGWSVFLIPLQERFDSARSDVNLTFTITLVVLGVTAGFGGNLQRRIGPRKTATIAGLLYGSGVLLSGLMPSLHALYITHGVIGGIGLGLGYIVPLAVLIGWFPDRRGFITGVAVAGFGLGAFLLGPLATFLIMSVGVQTTLMMLGAAYFAVVVIAAQFLRPAPDKCTLPQCPPFGPRGRPACPHMTLKDALRTPDWYLLWSILAINVTAGAAVISVAAPLTQELTAVGAALGGLAVSAIALFNGIGRLFWGTLSDRIGRASTAVAILMLQVPAFLFMADIHDFAILLSAMAIIALCYGGGFGIMPAFTADVFGSENSGTIYGAMLTAWSAGAIVGPLLIATTPYHLALPLIASLLLVAAALTVMFPILSETGNRSPAFVQGDALRMLRRRGAAGL